MSAERRQPGSRHVAPSPELADWLRRHIGLGFDVAALVRSMCQSGHEAGYAREMVEAAFADARRAQSTRSAPANRPAEAASSAEAAADPRADSSADSSADQPEPAVEGAPTGPEAARRLAGANVIHHDGREIAVLFSLASPSIVLFQHLLSADECDALIALSRGKLVRSPVVNPETGRENLIDARTSRGAMFQVGEHPLIERIEARIAAVTGMPVEHGEGVQILHYRVGAEYRPHFDYFNPSRPGEARQLEVGGQRVATLVIYLNDVPAGGGTAFPKLGLEIAPVRGNAVLFRYLSADGALDDRTLHAGLPVESGEKWIATKWLRERPYRWDSGRNGS